MEVVVVLRNARRVAKGEDPRAPCLGGRVYGDTKGRFRDGERVTTSTIMSEEGDVFRTRFSVYRVESWASDADGWIEWAGGKRPVGEYVNVDIRFRYGGEYLDTDAGDWVWEHLSPEHSHDIVAYRLSKDDGK